MGFIRDQFADVVEWEEYRDDLVFWKWPKKQIKKGSKLILRPGQDAVFMFNGKYSGFFQEEGEFDIESQIIPVLSQLMGFKYAFDSGMRAEVLFVNTKEFPIAWGTPAPIMLPAQGMPGGMPIRANGTAYIKTADYSILIDKVAGVTEYSSEDAKKRIMSLLNQLLTKHIAREGKDMFNLQANSFDISKAVCEDLDMELLKDGISCTRFDINSITYPKEVQDKVNQVAAQSMVGDIAHYQQVSLTDAMASGNAGGGTMGQMAEMMMGATMAGQMMNNINPAMQQTQQQTQPQAQEGAKFCPQCGTALNGAKFCPQCGTKIF